MVAASSRGREHEVGFSSALARWVGLAALCGAAVSPSLSGAQVPAAEREALIAFYNATQGWNWDNNTKWRNFDGSDFNSPGTECTWYGITCSSENRVTSVTFLENNLTGVIPPELQALTELRYFQLNRNDMTGPVPAWLGDLSSLVALNLRVNNFTGQIPPELGRLRKLSTLDLSFNSLIGEIPPELGDLDELRELDLHYNNLTGVIPPELRYLSMTSAIRLAGNRLKGTIPPELAEVSLLRVLTLDDNLLEGPIPAEFGGLSRLYWFSANGNRLSGAIPPEMVQLTALAEYPGLMLSWNALSTDDPDVDAFIATAHRPPWDFYGTQTLAPDNPIVESVHDHTVWLAWDPVDYLADEGGYVVVVGGVGTGDWEQAGIVVGKASARFPVTGLDSGTTYDLAVQSYTDPHAENRDRVTSDVGAIAMATTSDTGCGVPVIEVLPVLGGSYQLTVPGSFDSRTWSTGETTESITVAPAAPTTYWVATTSPGPCEEAATALVDPGRVFSDGFEGGDLSSWSASSN